MYCLKKNRNNKNAREIAKKMSCVYGQGVIIDCQAWNCFSYFRSVDTSLRDDTWLGRSSVLNWDTLRELVECNPRKSTWELAVDLSTPQFTIYNNLQKIGKANRRDVRFPYTVSEKITKLKCSVRQVFFQEKEINRFSRISLQVMENGFLKTMFYAKGSELMGMISVT